MRSVGSKYYHLIPRDYNLEPKQIRVRLIEYGLTIAEFAKLVGVGPDHMSNLLNGSRQPSFVVKIRIQDVLRQLHEETVSRKEA